MSEDSRIIQNKDYVTFALKGPVSADSLIELARQLMSKEGFVAHRRLWDFRESGFDLSLDDLRRVADFVRRGDTAPARVALLVAEDLSYGVSRMYEVLRSSKGTEVMVFRDEDRALAWLLS